MAEINLAEDFDPDAPPESAPARLTAHLRTIRRITARMNDLEAKRKRLYARVVPMMKTPVTLLDPLTGAPIVAAPVQAMRRTVDAGELKWELAKHFESEGLSQDDAVVKAENIWSSVLKPVEVDTKDDGLFVQACQRGDIPLAVVAKVVKETPNNAFVQFPKRRPT